GHRFWWLVRGAGRRRRTARHPHPGGGSTAVVRVSSQVPPRGGGRMIAPEITQKLEEIATVTQARDQAKKRLAELESERARIVLALHSEHGLSIRSIAALLAAAQMPITPAGVQKLVEKARKERCGPALADYWRQHDMKQAGWSGERIGLPPVRYPLAALVGANTRDTSTPWVAEIVGLSAKYGYDRRFLRGKEDWSQANSAGSRGVRFYFTLEEGRYYEAYRRVSNN